MTSAGRSDWLAILKYPPPASFLNLTSAKSGSTPVVSQSMSRPMVPVGAMTVVCALRIAVLFAEEQARSQHSSAATSKSLLASGSFDGELRLIDADGVDIQLFVRARWHAGALVFCARCRRRRGGDCGSPQHLVSFSS